MDFLSPVMEKGAFALFMESGEFAPISIIYSSMLYFKGVISEIRVNSLPASGAVTYFVICC